MNAKASKAARAIERAAAKELVVIDLPKKFLDGNGNQWSVMTDIGPDGRPVLEQLDCAGVLVYTLQRLRYGSYADAASGMELKRKLDAAVKARDGALALSTLDFRWLVKQVKDLGQGVWPQGLHVVTLVEYLEAQEKKADHPETNGAAHGARIPATP